MVLRGAMGIGTISVPGAFFQPRSAQIHQLLFNLEAPTPPPIVQPRSEQIHQLLFKP
jgi:ABC-type cobalt transport system substrate-binding protein